MELVGQEVSVGSFSSGISWSKQTTATSARSHRPAGLEAHVIVWIASECRDPHRSAIHWLNDHTVDPLVFITVQVQTVRIGESPSHPMGKSSLVVVTDLRKRGLWPVAITGY